MNKTVKLFAIALLLVASTSLVKASGKVKATGLVKAGKDDDLSGNKNEITNNDNNIEQIEDTSLKNDTENKNDDNIINENINNNKKISLENDSENENKDNGDKSKINLKSLFGHNISKLSNKWVKLPFWGKGLTVGVPTLVSFFVIKKIANRVKNYRKIKACKPEKV